MHEIVASQVDSRWGLLGEGGGRGDTAAPTAIASYRFVLAAAKRAAKSKMLNSSGSRQLAQWVESRF